MPRAARDTSLVKQLRQELPRLLREDAQVRGEVIGILSDYLTTREETAAILAELRQMRADFDRRMDEQGRRIEEQGRRIEEQGRLLAEHTRRLGSLERTLGAIGARWGIMTEEAFRNGVRVLFAEQPMLRVEEWRYHDAEGLVFGYPSDVQVDVLVRDGAHVLVEIKSSVSPADVASFARKAELYRKVSGHELTRLLMISPFIDEHAKKAAARLGVDVHTGTFPPPIG